MNWKLVFGLSLFGLAMGAITVYAVPMTMQWILWLVIFIICAYVIAKNAPGNYFLHGFLVSIVNSIWITAIHVILFAKFVANNPDVIKMNENMPFAHHPKRLMVIAGPIIVICLGLVLGLFAFIASRIVRKPPRVAGSH